jgi:hypothetical protein
MAAPFHAIGVLRQGLTKSAFATDGYASGLDVIRGLSSAGQPNSPVLWPGNGASIQLSRFGGELPDPLESCGWTSSGLPLIALLPNTPASTTTASLRDASGQKKSVCVVTARSFTSSDPVYGSTGQSILAGANAVLIIPHSPLASTRYTVRLSGTGQKDDVTWSFYRVGYRGQRLPAGSVTPIHVADSSGEPVNAIVHVIAPAGGGHVTAFPCGAIQPSEASLTYRAHTSATATISLEAGSMGDICVHISAATHLTWHTAPAAGASERIFDSRLN